MSSIARLSLETVEGTGLRFRVSADRVQMTLEGGPEAASPTPMQAVLAAVGGCTAMDVISILRKKRQPVTAYEIEVVGERAEQHPKVYTRIEVLHRVRGRDISAAAVEEAIRLSDTKYCSVQAMLRATVEITSRYEILPE